MRHLLVDYHFVLWSVDLERIPLLDVIDLTPAKTRQGPLRIIERWFTAHSATPKPLRKCPSFHVLLSYWDDLEAQERLHIQLQSALPSTLSLSNQGGRGELGVRGSTRS